MVQSLKEILIERDGMAEHEAEHQVDLARREIEEIIEDGDLDEAENYMKEEFGLEPDYLEEFLF